MSMAAGGGLLPEPVAGCQPNMLLAALA